MSFDQIDPFYYPYMLLAFIGMGSLIFILNLFQKNMGYKERITELTLENMHLSSSLQQERLQASTKLRICSKCKNKLTKPFKIFLTSFTSE